MKERGTRGNMFYRIVPLTSDGEPDHTREPITGTGDVALAVDYESGPDARLALTIDDTGLTNLGFDDFRFECYPRVTDRTCDADGKVSYGYIKALHVRVITPPDAEWGTDGRYLRLIPVDHALIHLGNVPEQMQEA